MTEHSARLDPPETPAERAIGTALIAVAAVIAFGLTGLVVWNMATELWVALTESLAAIWADVLAVADPSART